MPVDRRAVLQLSLLLLAVPAQYLFTRLYSTTEAQRTGFIKRFLLQASGLKKSYLSWNSWQRWCISIWDSVRLRATYYSYSGGDDMNGESPAVDVMHYSNPKGYYGLSPQMRLSHPKNVRFRVGQVVLHKVWQYRAVIIGWDVEPKAPESWLTRIRSTPGQMAKPHYAVLINSHDNMKARMAYVTEENLVGMMQKWIDNKYLDRYFNMWDGSKYLARPWLRAVYPYD